MRIAKYISDLLFEYECVVIPGFGGFICNEVPARIDGNQHNFNPPSKKIVFNANLRVNDGLLVNHIAASENISYSEARLRVESFVRKCDTALEYGKRVNFHKIGCIFKNAYNQAEFEPDTSQNFNADAFGLSAFISPPIRRDNNLRINKKFHDRKASTSTSKSKNKIKQEKEPRYISISLMPVLIIAVTSALFFFYFSTVKELYLQYGSSVPFFYSSDNFVINNLDKIPYRSISTTDLREENSEIVEQPEAQKEVSLQQKEASLAGLTATEQNNVKIVEEKPMLARIESAGISLSDLTGSSTPEKQEPKKYFIIAGSFQDEENAQKLVDRLRAKGYGAQIVDKNKYDMYRVSFEGFIRKQEAEEALAAIRNEENPSAWLYKK